MLSYNNTAKEIKESGVDTAILPIGSVEQHSAHLPIATDVIFAEKIGMAIAGRINALLLPTLPISTCYEHKGIFGSVGMRPITMYQVIQDVILSLKEQGFKKVIVVLGHGGIFVAGPAIRELNANTDGLRVVLIDPLVFERGRRDLLDNKENEIHAGECETSVMLYLCEELVKKEYMPLDDCQPKFSQGILNSAPIAKLSETGAWGKPSLATREKGEKIFNLMVDNAVEYIETALSLSPEEKW